MKNGIRFAYSLLCNTLVVTLSACGSNVETSDATVEARSEIEALAAPPVPVASFNLENGNVIEFYDFPSGVLISEEGEAGINGEPGTKPGTAVIPRGVGADRVVDIWKLLAPKSPVPDKVVAMQERFVKAETQAPASGRTQIRDGSAPTASPTPTIHANTLQGCNNGCCDYNWLLTFQECNNSGAWNYSWFDFNYGWSDVSGGSIYRYDGLACSAIGTSTYYVSINEEGGTWSVAQAHYRTFFWAAALNFWGNPIYETPSTHANTSSSQHLHTYCGTVGF